MEYSQISTHGQDPVAWIADGTRYEPPATFPAMCPHAMPARRPELAYASPPYDGGLGHFGFGWVNDGTDADDAIAWLARGRGPSPEEWGTVCQRAIDERGDEMAEREDAARCA